MHPTTFEPDSIIYYEVGLAGSHIQEMIGIANEYYSYGQNGVGLNNETGSIVYVKKGNHRSKERVFIVHRLDRDTSGVLLFAKSEKAKIYLQEQWTNFSKTYFAVVHGIPSEKEGTITTYLLENKAHRMYSSKDETKGKYSKTGYKIVQSGRNFSLLEVALYTGRKNQIRVHLSEKGHPVVGDKAYGKGDKGVKGLALHAAKLSITHPHSKEEMIFETPAPSYFKSLAKG